MFRRGAQRGGMAERKAMIDSTHPLPISRQAQLSVISHGSVYYEPKPVGAADLVRMRRLDAVHLEHPFMGACIGMEALFRKPGTSKKYPRHVMYPYLLRRLTIKRANQVWVADISAPCRRGWRKTNFADWLQPGSWNTSPAREEH